MRFLLLKLHSVFSSLFFFVMQQHLLFQVVNLRRVVLSSIQKALTHIHYYRITALVVLLYYFFKDVCRWSPNNCHNGSFSICAQVLESSAVVVLFCCVFSSLSSSPFFFYSFYSYSAPSFSSSPPVYTHCHNKSDIIPAPTFHRHRGGVLCRASLFRGGLAHHIKSKSMGISNFNSINRFCFQ